MALRGEAPRRGDGSGSDLWMAHDFGERSDDFGDRSAGGEYGSHAGGQEPRDVVGRNDAAAEDGDSAGAALAQELDDSDEQTVVRTRQETEAYGGEVSLERRVDDLVGRAADARVGDLEAGVAEQL